MIENWRRNGWVLLYGIGVAAYLATGLLVVWSGAEPQWAGAAHWLTAALALAIGFQFGTQLTTETYRFLVIVSTALLFVNGVFCLLQMQGYLYGVIPGQILDLGRPAGTFPHPSALGKFTILTLILILPALRSKDRVTQRAAWWFVGLSVPIVALTLARANLVALVIAIGLWLAFERSVWTRNPLRALFAIAVAVAATPFVSATLARFYSDPGGGDRGRIYEVGLIQIRSNFWAGTGPNYYSEVVGAWDRMTFWGFPLHNSFLYPVAELGVVGGILFVLPVLVICAIAIVDCIRRSRPTLWSKAYLVTFPGIVAMSMTGWGMLAAGILCYWYFVIGVCAGGILRGQTGQDVFPVDASQEEAPTRTRRVSVPHAADSN